MGEVYRARDLKLGRDVAVKILPDAFAADADRLARFAREAKTLAALNHPNIAQIYGVEDSTSVRALVMELVDGDTLDSPSPRPVREALVLARQIADALQAAHEQGIVHRDLKPANIKVRPDGTIKILDFGLAKLTLDTSDTRDFGAAVTHSPTMTIGATKAGVILGTAPYMSPEQAKGRPADKRSDVWAFGCVLYEMLTGQRAFEGDHVSEILANVLKTPPDWSRLPADTPSSVRRLLRRCLEKDQSQRLADLSSARLDIDDAMTESAAAAAPESSRARRRWLPWAVALATAIAAVTLLIAWAPWRSAAAAPSRRLTVELGTPASLGPYEGAAMAVLSPDGGHLAFIAQPTSGQRQLYVRRMDQLQASPLAGTDGANSPFFSPDGQWVGFFADGRLKKISITGGAAVTLADTPAPLGATWTDRDTIIFAAPPQVGVLMEIPAAGGKGTPITGPPQGAIPLWPHALPGSSGVMFTALTGPGALGEATIMVQRAAGSEPQMLVRGAHYGRYVDSGHLLYMSQGTVFAMPFDLAALKATGSAVPVVDSVQFNTGSGAAQFEMSRDGTLVFVPGGSQATDRPLSWLTQSGASTPIKSSLGIWGTPRFSPDGRRVAMSRLDRGGVDIWTYDWQRDVLERVTEDRGPNAVPVWTRDGRRITFGWPGTPNETTNLFWKRADGTGEVQRLTKSPIPHLPGSWHPTRPILAFYAGDATTARKQIMLLELDGDEASGWKPREPTELIGGPYRMAMPVFSEDGKWLAYLSEKTGRFEVYVRPFPGPGDDVQLSSGGGNDPRWSRQRRELLYTTFPPTPNPRGQIMVVPYAVEGSAFRPEKPRPWSPATLPAPPYDLLGVYVDLHPDGQRFVVATIPAQASAGRDSVVVAFNFSDELRRRAPSGK